VSPPPPLPPMGGGCAVRCDSLRHHHRVGCAIRRTGLRHHPGSRQTRHRHRHPTSSHFNFTIGWSCCGSGLAPPPTSRNSAKRRRKRCRWDLDFVQDHSSHSGTEWEDLVLVEDLDLGLDLEVLVERRRGGILSAVVFEQSIGPPRRNFCWLTNWTSCWPSRQTRVGLLVGSRVGRLVGTRVGRRALCGLRRRNICRPLCWLLRGF
jgi:hypothetical protein